MEAQTQDRRPDSSDPESVKVAEWRQVQFYSVLKKFVPEEQIDLHGVQRLVESKARSDDLKDLLEKGCPPNLAIDILV